MAFVYTAPKYYYLKVPRVSHLQDVETRSKYGFYFQYIPYPVSLPPTCGVCNEYPSDTANIIASTTEFSTNYSININFPICEGCKTKKELFPKITFVGTDEGRVSAISIVIYSSGFAESFAKLNKHISLYNYQSIILYLLGHRSEVPSVVALDWLKRTEDAQYKIIADATELSGKNNYGTIQRFKDLKITFSKKVFDHSLMTFQAKKSLWKFLLLITFPIAIAGQIFFWYDSTLRIERPEGIGISILISAFVGILAVVFIFPLYLKTKRRIRNIIIDWKDLTTDDLQR